MQHGALEAERSRAFELVGGGFGHGGGERGESGEARRIAGNDFMQPVVDAPRDGGGGIGGKFLRRRRAVREHLDVDSRFVHFFEPQGPEIFEPRILLARPAGLAAGKGLFQLVVPVMLFDGNDRTMQFLEQTALPLFCRAVRRTRRGSSPRAVSHPGASDRSAVLFFTSPQRGEVERTK